MFNHFIFILLSVTFLFSVPCIYSYQFPFLLYFTTAISVFPFSLIVYFPCLSLSISLTLYYVFISIGLFLSNQHQKMVSYHWRQKSNRIIRLKFYGGLNTRNVVYISYIHIYTSLFAKETSVLGKEEAFQNLQSNLRESFQRHYKAKQRKLYRSN